MATPLPSIVQDAVYACKGKEFQTFLEVTNEAAAKAVLCERCQITTRSQLATVPAATVRFKGLMSRFNTWKVSGHALR